MQGRSERGGAAPRERARTQQCASATPPGCAGARGADAQKGLFVNSTNLCKGKHKAKIFLKAHSGRVSSYKTPLKPTSCKKKKHRRRAVR